VIWSEGGGDIIHDSRHIYIYTHTHTHIYIHTHTHIYLYTVIHAVYIHIHIQFGTLGSKIKISFIILSLFKFMAFKYRMF